VVNIIENFILYGTCGKRAVAWRSSEKNHHKLQKLPKLSNAFLFIK